MNGWLAMTEVWTGPKAEDAEIEIRIEAGHL